MNIHIRDAIKTDYLEVIQMYGDFVEDMARYENHDNDSFYELLLNKDFWIKVAEHDSELIGFITFSKRKVVRYPNPIVEVEEFYVKPEFRRNKIGTKLIEKVFQYAKSENCQYIFIASAKNREFAHSFYRSLGFDEYALHFRKKP
jgi:GNAT superfamily N-acetyltransferase